MLFAIYFQLHNSILPKLLKIITFFSKIHKIIYFLKQMYVFTISTIIKYKNTV